MRPQENFEDILTLSRCSRLRSRLTALLAVSYEHRHVASARLTAASATTYQLMNSTAWFDTACAVPETREWLTRALARARPIYLVVGYHTLTDARATERVVARATADGGARVSGAAVLGATAPAALGYLLTSKVDRGRCVKYSHSRSFDAPGEQIYAIQYRKVESRWFASRRIDNSSLEQDNRWKVYWAGDGRRGQQQWYTSPELRAEEEEVCVRRRTGGDRRRPQSPIEAGFARFEEGRRSVRRRVGEGIEWLVDGRRRGSDDSEELLEADLTDEIGFESSEKYISQDGEEEFLF